MNGIKITRRNDTIFVPLPGDAQRPIEGGCQCSYCKNHPSAPPMWDTLALATDPKTGDYTWTVHYPELPR